MRWQGRRGSTNIEDRRGQGFPGRGIVGGGIGAVVLALLVMLLGGDPGVILGPGTPEPGPGQEQYQPSPREEELANFVSVVLADTEDVWHSVFAKAGKRYEEPVLVLFSGGTTSSCGTAASATGPFYCPLDHKLYLDLSFFEDLDRSLGAPGDFARAYVIAHEVGHHVQNLLGVLPRVHELRQRSRPEQSNRLSVQTELQADCLAGVWAHHADRYQGVVEEGDLQEAVRAAESVGDDRLQRRGQGRVVPDSFTHGSSAQRVQWFRTGFRAGDPGACNTFGEMDRP